MNKLYSALVSIILFTCFTCFNHSVAFSQAGVLDVTFGKGGKVITQVADTFSRAFDLAIQPDLKILVAGDAVRRNEFLFALTRYNKDGSLDASFGEGGKVLTSFGTFGSSAKSMVVQ